MAKSQWKDVDGHNIILWAVASNDPASMTAESARRSDVSVSAVNSLGSRRPTCQPAGPLVSILHTSRLLIVHGSQSRNQVDMSDIHTHRKDRCRPDTGLTQQGQRHAGPYLGLRVVLSAAADNLGEEGEGEGRRGKSNGQEAEPASLIQEN